MGGSLDNSYSICADIVRQRPIGLSPWIDSFPRDHRRDSAAVLALARTLRDMVEAAGEGTLAPEEAREGVGFWRQWLVDGCWDDVDDPIAEAVRYAVLANEIPQELLIAYADAMAADLEPGRRFQELTELVDHCYSSSSTVWLAVAHILEAEDVDARARIAEMGVAVRLTEVICGVGQDLRRGRIYLPLSMLSRNRVSEAHLRAKVVTKGYARLTEDLMTTAESYFDSSLAGLHAWPTGTRRGVAEIASTHRELLQGVRKNRYDNITLEPEVSFLRRQALRGRALIQAPHGSARVPEGLPDGSVLIEGAHLARTA